MKETTAGSRLRSLAIVQQQTGTLARLIASQGQADTSFYFLLRPAPGPMADSLVKSRPDLRDFVCVGVEPAFPADGTSGCLACVVPESPAAAFLAKRAQDPGLRPGVVRPA